MNYTTLDNKFKDKNPTETINNIKSFFENKGFEINVEYINAFENIHSCKVDLLYNNELIHRSYGKGTTKEFSEASGCAEMVEVIATKWLEFGTDYLIKQNIERKKPFYIAKDEKIFTYDEIKNINYKMLTKLKKGITEKKYKEILFNCYDFIEDNQRKYICLPFKNMFTEEIEYVPYRIYSNLAGSNGHAAGNTFEEASVQAISEIIERKVMKEIGIKKNNIPIIPNEEIRFLNINLYNTIKEIEKDGQYKIVVKETSLKMGFPSISVVLFDKLNFGYLIKTGVSPVFDIALERCLTELYQTQTKNSIFYSTVGQKLIRKKENDFTEEDKIHLIESYTYYNDSFFLTNNKKYSISHFSKEKSNKEFLMYYQNLLKKNGYEIFYREEKLGDMTVVNICIPFMSEVKDVNIENLYNVLSFNKETTNKSYLDINNLINNHICITTQDELNENILIDYDCMVKEIMKDRFYNANIYCTKIKKYLDKIYYSKSYESYSNSFKQMFYNLYNIISIIDTFMSFYNHKEESLLLIDNPFVDNKSKILIQALKENNKEKIATILLDESIFINKTFEKELINAFDKISY